MIKQERYDTHSRQFPPGINGPLKVKNIFSHFLLLEFSLLLFFRNHKKWFLLSFTLATAEVQPIKAESESSGKNTAKDNCREFEVGGDRRLGQTQLT